MCGSFSQVKLFVNSKLSVSIDIHFFLVHIFVCQMSKTCKHFIKNTHYFHPQAPVTTISNRALENYSRYAPSQIL